MAGSPLSRPAPLVVSKQEQYATRASDAQPLHAISQGNLFQSARMLIARRSQRPVLAVLTSPPRDQVVDQDDHCHHYQDVNQVATEATDETQ
jgi:hypothetical protein